MWWSGPRPGVENFGGGKKLVNKIKLPVWYGNGIWKLDLLLKTVSRVFAIFTEYSWRWVCTVGNTVLPYSSRQLVAAECHSRCSEVVVFLRHVVRCGGLHAAGRRVSRRHCFAFVYLRLRSATSKCLFLSYQIFFEQGIDDDPFSLYYL